MQLFLNSDFIKLKLKTKYFGNAVISVVVSVVYMSFARFYLAYLLT